MSLDAAIIGAKADDLIELLLILHDFLKINFEF